MQAVHTEGYNASLLTSSYPYPPSLIHWLEKLAERTHSGFDLRTNHRDFRPVNQPGPKEVERQGSALIDRLRAAATLCLAETTEEQRWKVPDPPGQSGGRGEGERTPDGEDVEKEPGHPVDGWVEAGKWESGNSSDAMGGSGMGGRHYYLGRNKEVYDAEVYDAEVYAIYRELRTIDQHEETGHQYTLFSDSASAVDRARSDNMGPGQRLAIAIHEAGDRITSHNNTVTVRRTPAHQGAEGNETADT